MCRFFLAPRKVACRENKLDAHHLKGVPDKTHPELAQCDEPKLLSATRPATGEAGGAEITPRGAREASGGRSWSADFQQGVCFFGMTAKGNQQENHAFGEFRMFDNPKKIGARRQQCVEPQKGSPAKGASLGKPCKSLRKEVSSQATLGFHVKQGP